MHRSGKIAGTIALSLGLITAVSGCSDEKTKSAPDLPNKFCWNAFDPEDVHAHLPVGDETKQDTDPFYFSERRRSVNCLIYVDGNSGFRASAKLEDDEGFTEWSTYESANPEPIAVGKKGIVWDTGAATHVACEPTASSGPSTGKFLRLDIGVTGTQGKGGRKTLPGILKQFTAFAQKELKCA